MTIRRIVIVGGGIAGLAAAFAACDVNPNVEIIVLEKETFAPYRKPFLPYVIEGRISRPEEIIMYSSQLLNFMKIKMFKGIEVYKIDTNKRIVKGKYAGGSKTFNYDALVLATGGYSTIPNVNGVKLRNIFTLRTFDDANIISRVVRKGEKSVVVGAGLVGLLIAKALVKRGVKTTLIVRSRVLRDIIEPDLSLYLQQKLQRISGLTILTGSTIDKIEGKARVEYVIISNKKIKASNIIFATGTKPSVKLAKEAGIEVGEFGVRVDSYMQTSVPDIYAAGDCAETLDFLTGKKLYVPVGSIAFHQGRIAGINAAGGMEKTSGFLRVQFDEIFGMAIASVGHSSETAKNLGIHAFVEDITPTKIITEKTRTAPNNLTKIKAILDHKKRIIGIQAIGYSLATRNFYPLIQAVKKQETIEKIMDVWKMPAAVMINLFTLKHKNL